MAIVSTLTERAFASRRRGEWEELDVLVRKAKSRGPRKLASAEVARLPMLYRSTCADLAAAEAARYSGPLIDYLRGLTSSAHAVLYAKSRTRLSLAHHAWLTAFPRAVRARWRAMTLAAGLFFVPLVIGLLLTLHDPTFAFRIVPEAMLRPLTEAYARGFDGGRAAGEGAFMTGFYINNNVGIALRCFALGIFFGLGSAFYLVHNGLSIGAVFGYVTAQGAGANIATFCIGHGSLELGAIVLAGGAGLSLGWAIVAPGELTRLASLQRRAHEIVVIIAGASVMLVMAALIEGFWSPSQTAQTVKLVVGTVLFVLTMTYVSVAGRGAPEERA
jgi:uncharacterized membrane protein SpoIIM required for sporulation